MASGCLAASFGSKSFSWFVCHFHLGQHGLILEACALWTMRWHQTYLKDKEIKCKDFPGGAVVKNLPASAGDMGSSPGPGRSHMPRSN